jgi:hypothetical protein
VGCATGCWSRSGTTATSVCRRAAKRKLTPGIRILRDSIFSKATLGTDLNFDGRTSNDLGDPDEGANGLQIIPVLTSAKTVSGKSTIKGRLNSTSNAAFTVRLFSNLLTEVEHEGKTYTLTDPAAITFYEVVEVLSEVLGKEVNYVDIPLEKAKERKPGPRVIRGPGASPGLEGGKPIGLHCSSTTLHYRYLSITDW